METHLTIKYLAPYLPYGLNVKCMGEFIEGSDEDNPTPKIFDLIGLLKNKVSVSYHGNKELFHYEDIFPILRPLSDLTKVIQVNGEKFIPVESLDFKSESELMVRIYKTPKDKPSISVTYKMMGDVFTDTIVSRGSFNETRYWIVQKLLEWHFDIFSLIDNELAIDINTL